jgi:hypothetical protein
VVLSLARQQVLQPRVALESLRHLETPLVAQHVLVVDLEKRRAVAQHAAGVARRRHLRREHVVQSAQRLHVLEQSRDLLLGDAERGRALAQRQQKDLHQRAQTARVGLLRVAYLGQHAVAPLALPLLERARRGRPVVAAAAAAIRVLVAVFALAGGGFGPVAALALAHTLAAAAAAAAAAACRVKVRILRDGAARCAEDERRRMHGVAAVRGCRVAAAAVSPPPPLLALRGARTRRCCQPRLCCAQREPAAPTQPRTTRERTGQRMRRAGLETRRWTASHSNA